MPDLVRKRLLRATVIYWTLLAYIMAALVWWFISLNSQNEMMRQFEVEKIDATINKNSTPVLYNNELQKINKHFTANRTKYLGEGSVFLLLIIVGAVFVYRSVRRQFKLQQQQQSFMMAVTHELKTPISITKLNLETLQKYDLDPDKQARLIKMTLQETTRLNTLTSNILFTAQLEGGRYRSPKEELALSDLLKDTIHEFRNRYPDRIFNELIETNADVKGDPLLIQILINNLLENAIKYSSKEKPITATLTKTSSTVVLHIIDEGSGIPEKERQKIFSKFYRLGNESTRKAQGTGLGLYLCRMIARNHNADILVTDNTPAGSNFAVTFKI
jgi:two-component system sensor histidine kinase CiaH